MKSEFTVKELRSLLDQGKEARPVFGPGVGFPPVKHDPRTKFDPRPWTDGTFRYHTWELTVVEPGQSVDEMLTAERHLPHDLDLPEQGVAA